MEEGQAAAEAAAAAWAPQPFLQPFMQPDFDVEEHATSILQQGNINQEVSKLSLALTELDVTIQSHVSLHYNDLLSRAVSNSQLEQSLAVMATHIESLQLSSERLRARVADPYTKISQGTQSLERLQQTADILRRVIRILQLSKRLSSQLGGAGELDLAKAASGLAELGELVEGDLSGIEVVEGEVRRMWGWRTDVERQGETLLNRGMETANQSQLGTGLQVFYNLGTLPEMLNKLLENCHAKLKSQATDLLDIRKISAAAEESGKGVKTNPSPKPTGPGKASMPAPSNMAAFRATLWTNLDQVMELVQFTVSRVLQLQKLLAKKQDPNTHLPYISALAQDGYDISLVAQSWTKLTKQIKEVLVSAAVKSNFIKQAFEGEYPKLLRLCLDLWSKLRHCALQANTTGLVMDESLVIKDPFLNEELCEDLRMSLEQFEHAYLARSLSRLFDPVNLMFTGKGIPSQEEVGSIFATLSSEINIGSVEPKLFAAVLKNVSKTIKLFCVKCEQAAKADSDASQVIGYPTDAQKQNVQLVNILADFQVALQRLVADNKSKKIDQLLEDGKGINSQMESTVAPLLSSVEDAMEAIFLTAHKEDFGQQEEAKQQPPCSPYMKELQAFLERISKDFLVHFTCKEFIDGELRPLAEKIIRQFVLHASLIRPLGSGGAMRLASDCAQLEFALSLILGPTGFSSAGPTGLNAIGPAYQLLRAFRALLFLNAEDLQSYEGIGAVVEHSVVLHLLISRCPDLMPSPQSTLGWGLARYTRWLQKHNEREKLLLIQGSLEAYVAAARNRNDKSYIPQYPVLLKILQSGLQ